MRRSHNSSMLRMLSLSFSFTCFLSSAAASHQHSGMNMIQRDAAVCSSGGLTACPNAIPFCCQTGTTCLALSSDKSSVLCCPPEAPDNCQVLQPVQCDLQSQNQTANPRGLLLTTSFDSALPTCGSGCCPLGYNCVNGKCQQSSAVAALQASITSSSSTTATSTATGTPTTTALPSVTAEAKSSGSSFPPGAVIVGLISGLLAGALITFGAFYLVRRRRQKQLEAAKLAESPDFSSQGPTVISDPFSATPFGSTHRTDFSGHQTSSHYTTAPVTPGSETGKRRSLFATPLKFGLPLNPKANVPPRPQRSDENMAELDGQTGTQLKPPPAHLRTKDDDPISGHHRPHSDDSYITTGSQDSEQRGSSEMISVKLMPEPLVPRQTDTKRKQYESTNTTWSEIMDKAGMRGRGDQFGKDGYPGRYSFKK